MARVVCHSQPFDPESCDTGSVVPIIDIVHVDDLTVLIVAASPSALRRALNTLLISLIELFSQLGLVINWNPGKTEVMLKFRIRGWSIQGTDLRVNVVHSCKHLGRVFAG